MAPDDDPRDPTVKELLAGTPLSEVIDEATAKELERWFGLPSFQELAEQPEPDDPELVAKREAQARATAAVDPALLERLGRSTIVPSKTLPQLEAGIALAIKSTISTIDARPMVRSIADPREIEIPQQFRDELNEAMTPQALLRDLHRPELHFEKLFERVDMAAEQRRDASAEVAAAMRTSWHQQITERPLDDCLALFADLRRLRRRPWTEVFAELPLTHRTVS